MYFNFGIPTGATGATGPAGTPNTLSIGTVETGDTSSATITGTSPNQTLNLVLEKGEQGIQGPIGNTYFTTFDVVNGKLVCYTSNEVDYEFQLNGNKLEVVLDE